MRLTGAIQEALIAILCYDDSPGGARFVRAMIPWEMYDPYYRDLARAAQEYLDSYDQPSQEHTLDLVESLKAQDETRADIFDRLFRSIQEVRHDLNREYVLGHLSRFCRFQRLRSGLSKAVAALESDEVDAAEQAVRQSLSVTDRLFDPGVRLDDVSKVLTFLDSGEECFPTGIPELDRCGLGPGRKRLHTLVALPGYGKTWWLIHLGVQALLSRLKVVHVSLEVSEQVLCHRYMQSFFAVSKRKAEVRRQKFKRDDLGRFIEMKELVVKDRPYLFAAGADDRRVLKVRRMLEGRIREVLGRRPPFWVKEFPTDELTVAELDAYLDRLEATTGFVPDLVLVDYADLFKTDADNYRQSVGQIYKSLRGLAVRRNLAVATASQANRTADGVRLITKKHIAEDWSKVATSDVVLTYNKTAAEHKLGLARLWVEKGREDFDKFGVVVSQAYSIGQFCLDSVGVTSTYWDHIGTVRTDGSDSED